MEQTRVVLSFDGSGLCRALSQVLLLRIQRKHFTLQCVLDVAQVDKHSVGSHSGARIKYTVALAVDRVAVTVDRGWLGMKSRWRGR